MNGEKKSDLNFIIISEKHLKTTKAKRGREKDGAKTED
jgi:hypothetical protein